MLKNLGTETKRADSLELSRFFVLWLFLFSLLTACAGTSAKFTTTKLNSDFNNPRVLIFPVDVNVFEIGVGGVGELKADWTEKGKKNVTHRLKEILENRGLEIIYYGKKKQQDETDDQTFKLIKKVGESIFNHYYIPSRTLPSKNEFSWSIGKTTSLMNEKFKADYGLFITMADTHSSSGRVALGIVTGLLLGYAPPSGIQIGRAYLVDLKTGDIVWFNHLAKESFADSISLMSPKLSLAK
jgi:hypothetical protein